MLAEGLFLGLRRRRWSASLLGIGLAAGLRALFKAIGFELPSNGTVIETRTIIVSLLVGIVVTLIATLAPAMRATRVPPVAALREGVVVPTGRRSRIAFPASIVMLLGGLALMASGCSATGSSNRDLTFVGVGAALLFLGVALLSPRLVRPIAGLIGAPMRGITGRLARENAMRQPGRTAATAAALMIGVTLVAFASIFAASARKTIHEAVNNGSQAQFIVQNTDGFSSFTPLAAKRVAQVPGVEKVSPLRFVQGKVGSKRRRHDVASTRRPSRTSTAPAAPQQLRNLEAGRGLRLQGLPRRPPSRGGGRRQDRERGRRSRCASPGPRRQGPPAQRPHDRQHAGRAGLRGAARTTTCSSGRPRARRTQDALKAALKNDFPQAEALTNQEFIDDQAGQIDQVLALIYALLALAIIVSLFGIVNTLVLSITERTRELGMLRAIGTSRRQVRKMIRYEAIITAMIGGILGIVLGVILALLVSQPIDDFKLSIPFGSLIVLLILSGFAGVLAAVLPARRAAKLDVLEALAYE